MIGLFCGTSASSSEEYKKVVRNKMRFFLFLALIGIFTIAISLLAEFKWAIPVDDTILGIYLGAGGSIFCISVIQYFKNRSLLYNSEKLKTTWVTHSDERNLQINSMAYRVSTAFLIITLYLTALIAGLWYPNMSLVLLAILFVFTLVYIVSYKIFSQRI